MYSIDNVGVGARLKELRLQQNIKKIDATMEFEISTSQYSRFENGNATISVDVLDKAHMLYGRSMDYILWGTEAKPQSVFFQQVANDSERDKRRYLKILYCLMENDSKTEMDKEDPMYKIFVDGLLEMIPLEADSTIPYVLEYEKNRLKISENALIDRIGITRYHWRCIMEGTKIGDIMIPVKIKEHFGYDLEFLIHNKITESMFFDKMYDGCSKKKQEQVMSLFKSILQSEKNL